MEIRGLFMAAIAGCSLLLNSDAIGDVKQQEKQVFDEVVAKLDPGGTYYSFQNNKYFFGNIAAGFTALEKSLCGQAFGQGPAMMQITLAAQGIKTLVTALGIDELKAFAASSILLEEGQPQQSPLFRNRMYFYHGATRPDGLLWMLTEDKKCRLETLNLLPKNTIYATVGQFYPGEIWKWAKNFAPKLAFPPASMAPANVEAAFLRRFKMPLPQFLDKLGGVWTLALTWERNADGKPILQGMLIAPVADNQPFDLLADLLKGRREVKINPVKREIIAVLPEPEKLPSGMPEMVSPVCRQEGNRLYLASSPRILADVKAAAAGNGLTSAAIFKRYSRGLPLDKGIQFAFLSGDIMDKIMETIACYGKTQTMSGLSTLFKSAATMSVMVRDPKGVLVVANSELDLTGAGAAQLNIAAASVFAGMLLPALNQAQEKAGCVNP